MACSCCIGNGCRGFSIDHKEHGCCKCDCLVSYSLLTGNVPTMKAFDRPNIFKENPLKRFFSRHKTFDKALFDFAIIWYTLSGILVSYLAGELEKVPNVPELLPFLLFFVATIFGYQVYLWSDNASRRAFQEKIDALESRIQELESRQQSGTS